MQSRVGLLGRSLKYGDLVIFTSSGEAGADRFKTITTPEAFRNAIMARKMAGGTSAGPRRPRPATLGAGPGPRRCRAHARAGQGPRQPGRPARPGAIAPEGYETKKAELLARM